MRKLTVDEIDKFSYPNDNPEQSFVEITVDELIGMGTNCGKFMNKSFDAVVINFMKKCGLKKVHANIHDGLYVDKVSEMFTISDMKYNGNLLAEYGKKLMEFWGMDEGELEEEIDELEGGVLSMLIEERNGSLRGEKNNDVYMFESV